MSEYERESPGFDEMNKIIDKERIMTTQKKHIHKFDLMKPNYPCSCGLTAHEQKKHTPTPWKSNGFRQVISNTGWVMANCPEEEYCEFIVKACNNFESLLSTCKEALDYLNTNCKDDLSDDANYLESKLETAIRQAEQS